MARWGRRSSVIATLLVLLTASVIPSLPLESPSSASSSPVSPALGGPGCGNGTDPCVVTFTEFGLPGSSNWAVSVNGNSETSGGSSLVVFDLVNGSWPFWVPSFQGYTASPSPSTVSVSGNDVPVSISFSLPTFTVTFTQTGLPGGTQWTVVLNGVSQPVTSPTDQFSGESNGTYPFTISSSDSSYTPSPSSGSVMVSGANRNVPVTFSQVTYAVSFTETGFPLNTGPLWSVNLEGNLQSSSSSNTISFSEPNGSYSYTFRSSSSEFEPVPPSGSLTVNGGPTGASVHFLTIVYSLYFNESGFPLNTGQTWTVTVGGNPLSSGISSTIVFPNEPNNTYSFTIRSSTSQYQPSPSSGTLVVNGHNAAQSVSFAPNLYPVYFNETGLGAGSTWSVAINGGTPTASSGPSIVFMEFNGTPYKFVVKTTNTSYQASPFAGTFSVSGRYVTEPITFTLVTFSISFSESGFPLTPSQPWSITWGGTLHSSTTTTIVFPAANGTFGWTVSPISGWHASVYSGTATISGVGYSNTVTWTRVVYDLWFNETGLPTGLNWGITANGTFANSTTTSIHFKLPNGTFDFQVEALPGYHASTYSGTVTLAGLPTTESIVWGTVVYTFTFFETGLPASKSWSVAIGGGNQSTKLPVLSFSLPNGTYNFTVGRPFGYVPFPPGGVVNVSGKSNSTSIAFTPFAFPVSFVESGLLPGVNWSVTVDGVRYFSNTSTVRASEANGSYSYLVNRVVGYNPSSPGGSFKVAGLPLQINITFLPAVYPIEFYPYGLLATQNWSVTVGGAKEIGLGNQAITFDEPNGTYTFSVTPLLLSIPKSGIYNFQKCGGNKLNISVPNGTATVCGRSIFINVTFSSIPGYAVTFSEQGLRTGVSWSVSVAGGVWFSPNPTMTVLIPNGTYSYYVGFVPGYSVQVTNGVLQVAGIPTRVNITYLWVGGTGPTPPGGFSSLEWTVVGSGAAAAAMVAIALIIRRKRNRPQSVAQ